MSEAFAESGDPEAPEVESDDTEQDESPEGDEGEAEGEEGEEGERPRKATDWEKQAHDKAGLAAKERSRRRAVERQNADLMARIEAIEAKTSQQTSDELADLIAGLRDDDDEPITDISQIKRALKTIMARQTEAVQTRAQEQRQVEQVRSISKNMDAFEKDFAEDHPDYVEAATYYRQARVDELEALGYSGERLMQKLATEFYTMANDVMASGRDPAEVVYGLAKKRGFAAGGAAANKKLQALQKVSATGATPRGGKGQDNGVTWDRVARATGAEKDRLWAKLRSQELGKR